MIDKEKARASGCEVIDHADDTKKREKLARLKALDPSLVNGDGIVDVNALKDFMGTENTSSNNKGFELTFAGKGLARAIADAPTTKELRIEKKQSKHFADTENVIIRGDNMDALKLLKKNYYGRIKMIYIDPPYNTQSEKFVYKDNFRQTEEQLIEKFNLEEDAINYLTNIYGTTTHSGWLAFMYPRLKLARDLLTDDGVILIQIDYNESHSLKLLLDEIYGEDNFKEEIVWEYRTGGMPAKSSCFGKKHDIIFAYSKNSEKYQFNNRDIKEKNYYEKQFFGCKTDENGRFYTDVNIRDVIGGDMKILEKGKEAVENLKPLINTSSERVEGFDSQKPPNLINFLAKFYIKDCEDSIVLDFFAGTGTTAISIINLNKEYGGNRKFILVQKDEAVPEDNKVYNLCKKEKIKPFVSDVCIWRVNRAGDELKQDMLNGDLDTGYKVFSLTERPELKEDEKQQFRLSIDRATAQDTLYNMFVLSGEALLTDPVEEIEPGLLYKVGNSYYLLGNCKADLKSADRVFVDGYADIDLEKWLNTLGLDSDRVKVLY